MTTSLQQIATLQTGLLARPEPIGEVPFLQLSHFKAGHFDPSSVESFIPSHQLTDRHTLQPADVLLAARGTHPFASLAPAQLRRAAASPSFIIIRPHSTQHTLPAYLELFLNLPATQALIKNLAKGSSLQAISIQALASLPVPIPTIQKQQQLVRVAQLAARHHSTLQQLASLHLQYHQQIIHKAIYA